MLFAMERSWKVLEAILAHLGLFRISQWGLNLWTLSTECWLEGSSLRKRFPEYIKECPYQNLDKKARKNPPNYWFGWEAISLGIQGLSFLTTQWAPKLIKIRLKTKPEFWSMSHFHKVTGSADITRNLGFRCALWGAREHFVRWIICWIDVDELLAPFGGWFWIIFYGRSP